MSFMGITGHFLEADHIRSVLLDLKHLTSSHTGDNIHDCIRDTMHEWNMKDKVNCIVTDTASNVVNAIRMLGTTHLRCFAHTLNLIANDGLKHITALREKCRDIVSYFHRSVIGTRTLEETQIQLKVPNHRLIEEVSTLWNSTYGMMSRLQEQEEAVKVALVRLDNPVCGLEKEVWLTIRDLTKVLAPLYEVTKEISAERNVNASKIIPFARILQASVNRVQQHHEDTENVKAKLRDSMM